MGEWRYSTTVLDLGTREIAPCTHWIGGWVGPRGSLCVMENKPTVARNRTRAVQPVARRSTD
jgi:hypothetical protein